MLPCYGSPNMGAGHADPDGGGGFRQFGSKKPLMDAGPGQRLSAFPVLVRRDANMCVSAFCVQCPGMCVAERQTAGSHTPHACIHQSPGRG